ncbi:hypothetical protein PR003_g16228 [Phytophthora rubi]|uniref:Uncharacterized protein n=1 Tax=Phytophthora rubi TaxID=129364 RepID=A0A6A4EMM6_9STRA|nr:hypothetical protein PR001_g2802 [Phytophthora rubi]KAE9326515.1 hypothetical protein PR003_g16228 [Phytophthora rubi]
MSHLAGGCEEKMQRRREGAVGDSPDACARLCLDDFLGAGEAKGSQ